MLQTQSLLVKDLTLCFREWINKFIFDEDETIIRIFSPVK